MSRPALHDPVCVWEGKIDDTLVRVVFSEMYDVTDDADEDIPASVLWMVHVEASDDDDIDAMGKRFWRPADNLHDNTVRCLALGLADALDRRPDWAKDPDSSTDPD